MEAQVQSHREQKEACELLPRLPLQREPSHLQGLEVCVRAGNSKLGKGCHNSRDYISAAGLQSAGNLRYSCSFQETLFLTLRERLAVFSSSWRMFSLPAGPAHVPRFGKGIGGRCQAEMIWKGGLWRMPRRGMNLGTPCLCWIF